MYLGAGSSADVTIPLVGSPTSVSFIVYDHVGQELEAGELVPEAGATEITLIVPGDLNTVDVSPSWERRTVRWSYIVGDRTVRGSRNYKIEAGVFHDADEDLVRSLLGVDTDALADSAIDLTSAYFTFRGLVDPIAMDSALLASDSRGIAVARAIAAIAALDHVDGMALNVAIKESSGSNQYERDKVDWKAARATLSAIVAAGSAALTTEIFMPSLFDVATRADVFTS